MYIGVTLQSALLAIMTIMSERDMENYRMGARRTFDNAYDYIVIGAGAAGAPIAARLSENPAISVLLLETGGEENFVTDVPVFDAMNLIPPAVQFVEYFIEPQKDACFGFVNNSVNWVVHNVLGGGSTLNGMVYNRGGPDDFNGWEKDYGCEGWSYENVLPYFLKSEDQKDEFYLNGELGPYHSTGGPLTITTVDIEQSIPTYKLLVEKTAEAATELGYGATDFNGPSHVGHMHLQRTIRKGRRVSTSSAFLYPNILRRNLHVLTYARANRILFTEDKRANGVEFDHEGEIKRVRALKEVIVSGGAIESPRLLMLSGIGIREELEPLGIPVIADLPVGENLQDHPRVSGIDFNLNTSVWSNWEDYMTIQNLEDYYVNGGGPLAHSFNLHPGSFINYKSEIPSQGKLYGPSDVFISAFMLWPGVNGLALSAKVEMDNRIVTEYYHANAHNPQLNLFFSANYVRSRGKLWLASPDPQDQVKIDPRYLSDREDLDRLMDSYKFTSRIGETQAWKALGAERYTQPIPTCVDKGAMDSDPYIECVIRTMFASEQHFTGTCRMGAVGDPVAVTDPRLRVQGGVKGLRVCDASIMPSIVTANPMAATIMIGERCADFVKQDAQDYY